MSDDITKLTLERLLSDNSQGAHGFDSRNITAGVHGARQLSPTLLAKGLQGARGLKTNTTTKQNGNDQADNKKESSTGKIDDKGVHDEQ